MISFRFKNQVKRVKIKTRQKLDERMSHWLQKVFSFKNQIIGFKSQDNRFFDVESFYSSVQKFFGSNVDIIEAGDQLQISFTSQNLNSSSFIRPSQPNTSQINQKELSEDQFQDFIVVNDRKTFQKKLIDGKDISLLFDVNAIYRKTLLQTSEYLSTNYNSFKINFYMYINNSHPKKSCLSIYIGKTCVITFPLLKNYIEKVSSFLNRYKNSSVLTERENKLFLQARASHQQQDQAPSFTTYHLAQRLNQQACTQYLGKMYRDEKCLRNYEYRKLIQKCEQNFSQFYRIFCEGVIDNDYQSFRNQILHKVQNNLELILSNVDEMDLSRPISREQQRRNNLKKSVPEIEIVKVENYFQILDQLKNQIDIDGINQIKQFLLDEDQQIFGYFSQYLSRDITQDVLAYKLNNALAKKKSERSRPMSRYLPSRPIKSKSVDPLRRKYSQQKSNQQNKLTSNNNNINGGNEFQNIIQEPPMFGSIKNQQNFSPIKYMSDIQSNYKQAWNKLSQKSEQFQPQQYGLLYHLLQKRDDSLSNFIQQLEWKEQEAIQSMKKLLKQKVNAILRQNFHENQIQILNSLRHTHAINCVYENFKYQSDLNNFIISLRQEIEKNKHPSTQVKMLHKKSSDSQLLQNKQRKNNRYGHRKFSDQNEINIDPRSPSPKDSQYSLYNKVSNIPNLNQTVRVQWRNQFQQMLKDINFTQQKKQQLIRQMYNEGNSKIYGWVRNYIKGHHQFFSSQQIHQICENEKQTKFLLSILPIFDQFLRLFVEDGLLTDKIRKWLIGQVLTQNINVIASFQLYLQTKQQDEFVDTLKLIYEHQNHQMEFYNTYLKRLQSLLKEMSINDEIGLQIFNHFPNSIKAICQLYFITGNLQDMMDTLEVLYKKQAQLRQIKAATLNFSGINLSPFEYHDGSQQADKLNQLFKANLLSQRSDFTKWAIGKIDKETKSRMCMTHVKNNLRQAFVLASDNKLPNKEEFQQIWRQKLQNEYQQLKNNNQKFNYPSQKQKQQCLFMDFLIYLTVVQYLYQIENYSQILGVIKQLDPKKLVQFLNQKANKPQCKMQIKQQMVMDYLLKNSIDVLFLQEAGAVDWNQLLIPEYSWIKNADSVIIYKKQKIGNKKVSLMQTYSRQLNFNQDSACFFSDKGYLLISAHLKSNKKHIQQKIQMMQTLSRIMKQHPMLKLIIGIDANHFIKAQDCPQDNQLNMVPNNEQVPTTLKKRTYLQAQFEKSDVQVSQVKDLIITNRNIKSYRVQDCRGSQIGKDDQKKIFIPNSSHPYDHFIVCSEII